MVKSESKSIYQLLITLKGIRPAIWRRLLVDSRMDLWELHLTVQVAMGWSNRYLHQFINGRKLYRMHDDEFVYGIDSEDETEVALHHVLSKEDQFLLYEYDFDDHWEHEIKLEEVKPWSDQMLPHCIDGCRACPPEDCGGIGGYRHLIKALSDHKKPEYQELIRFVGPGFDPDRFDLEETDFAVQELFKQQVMHWRGE
ncbi:plasmid pRiA4b ORF-3 family protein [Dongshaea marina]|uniref:plasmid pRiA4b ORF-3 family protein n=1 Tax=Dongshaea marina TaxID=2047966 RepID=UPI000D3E7338|nr:plasmid pRiA4b ORF-3 family protein [Dongshaea marina]